MKEDTNVTFLSRLSPARRILLSFALVIVVGSLLLNLPFMQTATSKANYFDHLFTSVSMVCVTGLFTQSVADTYNVWGQIICMLLIQIGGLGLISFIGLIYVRSNQKLSFSNRTTLQESLSRDETNSIRDFLRSIFSLLSALKLLEHLFSVFALSPF